MIIDVVNDTHPLKVVIINKSDSTGGAAVVSRRLMDTLRSEGVDARMLVVEKLTDSPYVEPVASSWCIKKCFLSERLKIFLNNGFNRKTLFKIDTASDGLPLWRHPLVKNADAVLLNWINQGMLSLKGIKRILQLEKPVLWTMHDMWCMTGICHHAGKCDRFSEKCGECPLLGRVKSANDLSTKIWQKKNALNHLPNKITYVAVSNWLAHKAAESSLLSDEKVTVIPNAFAIQDTTNNKREHDSKIRILFGAARLDDPIKGLPVLKEMTNILKREHPELTDRLQLITFGSVKHPESLEGLGIKSYHLGMIKGEDKIKEVYESGNILVSASSYETLPGTLVEAQAYGCIPVSFNQGGQADIIDHLITGYIADYSTDIHVAARNLTNGVLWAIAKLNEPDQYEKLCHMMKDNVQVKFSPKNVVKAYIKLIKEFDFVPKSLGQSAHKH